VSSEEGTPLPSFQDRPTAEYVRELFEHNNTHWGPQFAVDKEVKDLINNEHAVEVPDTNAKERKRRVQPEVVKVGEAKRIRNTVTSFYVVHSPLGVQWLGQKKKSPGKQDDVEVALNEAIDQMVSLKDLANSRENQVVLGRTAELLVAGNRYYYDFPEKRSDETETAWQERYLEWNRGGPLPVEWQVLPAESTFPPSIGDVEDEVLSTVQTTWNGLLKVFSEAELGGLLPEKDRWEEVTLGIYANKKWLAYVVLQGGGERRIAGIPAGRKPTDDVVLRPIEHGMHRCPIRILDGETTGDKRPGYYWKGVLHDVRDLCVALDKRYSEASTGSHFSNLPMFKRWLQDRGIDAEGASSDVAEAMAGDILDFNVSQGDLGQEDMQPLFQPQFGVQTLQLIQMLQPIISTLSGATEGLEGSSGPTNQAAWARALIIELATSHFKPLTSAITAGDINRMETFIEAVSAHGERITLNPRGQRDSAIYLDPKELPNWSPYLKAEFRLQTPQNKSGNADLMISMLERNKKGQLGVSKPWIMSTFGGIENPMLHLREQEMYELLEHPLVKEHRVKRLLKEVDLELGQEETIGMEELLQSGLPPEIIQALVASALPQAQPQNGQDRTGMGGANIQGGTQGMLRAQNTLGTAPVPAAGQDGLLG
jgi:hypothetical protein